MDCKNRNDHAAHKAAPRILTQNGLYLCITARDAINARPTFA